MRTHPARHISTVWLVLSLAGGLGAVSACGSDDSAAPADEAGAGGGGAAGGGSQAGGGGADNQSRGAAELGAACTRDAECGGDLVCDEEVRQSSPVSGSPSGSLDQVLFPGGACTPVRATTYDPSVSCDPTEPIGAQGCGDDGVCDLVARTNTGFLVGCRKTCDPVAEETGCREGYECSYGLEACVEGCQSDDECRISNVDTDDDGLIDMLVYDADSGVTCDPVSARCVHPAGSQASGESCARDDECPQDGLCISEDVALAGQTFPGGACTRRGCQFAGNECDGDSVCEPLRPWIEASPTQPLCLQRCTVGAEAEELKLGPTGHGEGCRDGYRCHWNGGMGAESGVCVGGSYNEVTENNIGAQCETDADCYSPYGLGACLRYAVSDSEVLPGICTVYDCAVPGVPEDLCGAGNECVFNGGRDETYCQHHCKEASECPEGFACTDDDENPASPKSCIPLCFENGDCRSGETCVRLNMTTDLGLCQLQ